MRRRAVTDEDQPLLRHSSPPRFGKAGDDEACPLVDRGIGDLELGVRKGNRSVALGRGYHLVGAHCLPQPGVLAPDSDFAHTGPQRAALRLTLGKRLAPRRAPGVLVERIDIDRECQAVALGVAGTHPVRRVAQRVRCRQGDCGAHRLAADYRADPRLARGDAVRGFVEQPDRAVTIGLRSLLAMRRRNTKRLGQLAIDRVELRPADLAHHRQAVAVPQPPATSVGIGPAQRFGHQPDRIEPVLGPRGPVVDLPHTDNHRRPFRVHTRSLARSRCERYALPNETGRGRP
ncbi:MAG TPA: hypothetical protein VFS87_10190 [Qipengyuania sp.]|nr:hypothetical protein [Qipengyuania sp.]